MTFSEAHRTTLSNEWNTPIEVLQMLAPLGQIALDPCSNAGSIVPARVKYDLKHGQDGLVLPWATVADCGYVFVNPPYGKHVGRWIDKAIVEAELGASIVMLLAARTDTRWFQRAAKHAASYVLLAGRLRFVGSSAPAPFPSVVFHFGHDQARFEMAVRDSGIVCRSAS